MTRTRSEMMVWIRSCSSSLWELADCSCLRRSDIVPCCCPISSIRVVLASSSCDLENAWISLCLCAALQPLLQYVHIHGLFKFLMQVCISQVPECYLCSSRAVSCCCSFSICKQSACCAERVACRSAFTPSSSCFESCVCTMLSW